MDYPGDFRGSNPHGSPAHVVPRYLSVAGFRERVCVSWRRLTDWYGLWPIPERPRSVGRPDRRSGQLANPVRLSEAGSSAGSRE